MYTTKLQTVVDDLPSGSRCRKAMFGVRYTTCAPFPRRLDVNIQLGTKRVASDHDARVCHVMQFTRCDSKARVRIQDSNSYHLIREFKSMVK